MSTEELDHLSHFQKQEAAASLAVTESAVAAAANNAVTVVASAIILLRAKMELRIVPVRVLAR